MASPTSRPTDADRFTEPMEEPPTDLLNQPWVDVHNHAHTLSWEDREAYALSGCAGMIMVAAGYHWTPYNPVRSADIRVLWDDAIDRRVAIQADHAFRTLLAIGIHTGVRVADPDEALAMMDAYCEHDAVVAIGETGVTPRQHAEGWELDAQRRVVAAQCEKAVDHGLPVILHTPSGGGGPRVAERPIHGIPGYEKNLALTTESVMTESQPAIQATDENIAAARAAGLPEHRLVVSHASPETIPYILNETDCYASITLGHQWLLGVTVADVADAIEQYGADRLMLETDCANILRSDPRAIKRAMLQLFRFGVTREDIRAVVWNNPRRVFDFNR